MANSWEIKVVRARELLKGLSEEIESYFEITPPKVRTELVESPDVYALVLEEIPAVPDRWSAIVGDIIHNLHSALDSVTYSIITKRAAELGQPIDESKIYFPFVSSPRKLRSFSGRDWFWHQKVGFEELFSAIDMMMPYYGDLRSDLAPEQIEAATTNSQMFLLRKLSNDDKHRSSNLTVCSMDSSWFSLPPNADAQEVIWTRYPWENRSEIYRVKISGLPSDFNLEFGTKFEIGLARDVFPGQAYGVIPRLQGLHSKVVWCVDTLSQFTTATSPA